MKSETIIEFDIFMDVERLKAFRYFSDIFGDKKRESQWNFKFFYCGTKFKQKG